MIQVTIDREDAEWKVNMTDISFVSQLGTGAGIGGSVGSIIPGVGSAIGTVVGTFGAGISRLFGIGGGETRSVRHTVRDFVQKAIAASAPNLIAEPYRETTSYSDCVVLAGEYSKEDIRKMLDSIFGQVLSQLQPGTDEFKDINNAYMSIKFVEGRHSDVCILKFSQKVISDDRFVNGIQDRTNKVVTGSGSGSVDGSSAANTKIVDSERVSGIPPVAVAVAIAGFVIFAGSR